MCHRSIFSARIKAEGESLQELSFGNKDSKKVMLADSGVDGLTLAGLGAGCYVGGEKFGGVVDAQKYSLRASKGRNSLCR